MGQYLLDKCSGSSRIPILTLSHTILWYIFLIIPLGYASPCYDSLIRATPGPWHVLCNLFTILYSLLFFFILGTFLAKAWLVLYAILVPMQLLCQDSVYPVFLFFVISSFFVFYRLTVFRWVVILSPCSTCNRLGWHTTWVYRSHYVNGYELWRMGKAPRKGLARLSRYVKDIGLPWRVLYLMISLMAHCIDWSI
jgi:hypothetical protein